MKKWERKKNKLDFALDNGNMICNRFGMGDMILSSAQEKADYEYVHRHWVDLQPMAVGRLDIVDMEGEVDYSAAREFTEERLEAIRGVEREIGFIESQIACQPPYRVLVGWGIEDVRRSARNVATWSRILGRERAALAELKRGMKI